jgi:hypothetical protein
MYLGCLNYLKYLGCLPKDYLARQPRLPNIVKGYLRYLMAYCHGQQIIREISTKKINTCF